MFLRFLLLMSVLCVVGCGADSLDSPVADLSVQETELVPGAPSAEEKKWDITKYAFTRFQTSWVIPELGEDAIINTHWLQVYKHIDAYESHEEVLLIPMESDVDPTAWKITFAPKWWKDGWQSDPDDYSIESAETHFIGYVIIENTRYEMYVVAATRADYKKARRLFKKWKRWRDSQNPAYTDGQGPVRVK